MAPESSKSNAKTIVSESTPLPEWCRVYEGLSEQEIADLEEIILKRADLTRPSPDS